MAGEIQETIIDSLPTREQEVRRQEWIASLAPGETSRLPAKDTPSWRYIMSGEKLPTGATQMPIEPPVAHRQGSISTLVATSSLLAPSTLPSVGVPIKVPSSTLRTPPPAEGMNKQYFVSQQITLALGGNPRNEGYEWDRIRRGWAKSSDKSSFIPRDRIAKWDKYIPQTSMFSLEPPTEERRGMEKWNAKNWWDEDYYVKGDIAKLQGAEIKWDGLLPRIYNGEL